MAKIYFESLEIIETEVLEDGLAWCARLEELRNQYGTITKIVYPSGYEWVPKN